MVVAGARPTGPHQAMLPGVDLPEVILEVMAEHPRFAEAFTSVSGGATRLADLHVSIAALLTSPALNVGLKPVVADLPALTRDRLAHVDQHYLRPKNYAAANAVLIDAQAAIPLAQLWGGGWSPRSTGSRPSYSALEAGAERAELVFHAVLVGPVHLALTAVEHLAAQGRGAAPGTGDVLSATARPFHP